jgi:hypothetical protein
MLLVAFGNPFMAELAAFGKRGISKGFHRSMLNNLNIFRDLQNKTT